MEDIRLMSRDFITEFISLYRQNECLWKIKSKDYTNKEKKSNAYDILVKKMREVDHQANKDSVVKKVNSLRTCFRKELKKYTASLQSGSSTKDIQKPNLWYFDQLLFLTDQETNRQDGRDNNESISSNPSIDIVQNFNVMDEGNSEDAIIVDEELQESMISQRSCSNTSMKSKSRKRDHSTELLDIIAHLLQSNKPTSSQTVGKYDAYGKYIAHELEDLPPNMAIYCKKVINEAIYHAQLGILTENSTVAIKVNPPLHVHNK